MSKEVMELCHPDSIPWLSSKDECTVHANTAWCVRFGKYLLELPVRGAELQLQFNVCALHRLLKMAVRVSGGVLEKTKKLFLTEECWTLLKSVFWIQYYHSKLHHKLKNSVIIYSPAFPGVSPNLYSVHCFHEIQNDSSDKPSWRYLLTTEF